MDQNPLMGGSAVLLLTEAAVMHPEEQPAAASSWKFSCIPEFSALLWNAPPLSFPPMLRKVSGKKDDLIFVAVGPLRTALKTAPGKV